MNKISVAVAGVCCRCLSVLSLCAWEELGGEPMSELGLWATPKAGLQGFSLTSQKEPAGCSMSHTHSVCWQSSDLLGMPREHEPSTGTTKGDGSGQPQAGAMTSDTVQARSLWDYLCIFTWHCAREVGNFLPVHLNPQGRGNAGVKVTHARAVASSLDFSLPFQSTARETQGKFGRGLSSEGTALQAQQGLLLTAPGLAGLESGQTALQGFGIHCWLCLAAAGGRGVLQRSRAP